MVVQLRMLGFYWDYDARSNIPVHGICVRRDKKQQVSRVKGIVRPENLIGCGEVVQDSDIKCYDGGCTQDMAKRMNLYTKL